MSEFQAPKLFAVLAASVALGAIAAPTLAQEQRVDDRYATVVHEGDYDGSWQGEWVQDDQYQGQWTGRYTEDNEREFRGPAEHRGHGMHGDGIHGDGMRGERHHGHHAASNTPRLAYSPAQRAEWLAQCRSLRADHDQPEFAYEETSRRDGNGGLVGGILGGVVGGVAGNRIAHAGDRLGGTLFGAGIGGIAGAVIGTLIDGSGRDREEVRPVLAEPGIDYCEAYLINYERGYGPAGQSTQIAYAPVMMMAAQPTRARRMIEIEDDVVVESHASRAPAPAPRRPAPRCETAPETAPTPQTGKNEPIR